MFYYKIKLRVKINIKILDPEYKLLKVTSIHNQF